MSGGSLAEWLGGRDTSSQGPTAVARVVAGVAMGVRWAHSRDVVHGDLTTARVLLGADGCPCIFGFGDGAAAGSPVARTDKDDVFAFGVMVWEIVGGRRLRPEQAADALAGIAGRGVHASFVAVTGRCLAGPHARRFMRSWRRCTRLATVSSAKSMTWR